MEVHIPTLPDATLGIEKGGSLRSRPPVPARRSRPGGRDATTSRKTTYAVADMHVRTAISRTCCLFHMCGPRTASDATDRLRQRPLEAPVREPRSQRPPGHVLEPLTSRGGTYPSDHHLPLVKQPLFSDISFAQIVQSIKRGIE